MKKEIYELTREQEETYWWYVARRKIILSVLEAVTAGFNNNSSPRLLDYGCGTGFNLCVFRSLGEAFGVDASEHALAACRDRGLKDVALLDGDFTETSTNPFGDPYDVITLLDVLEHIEDDVGFMQHLKAWIAPEGCILVTVPTYPFLWSGEDHVSEHKRRYTRASLEDCLERAGYHIERSTYFNTLLFPLQASVILLRKWFVPGATQTTNLRPLPQWMNTLLQRIMGEEAGWLEKRSLPFGGSLLVLARPAGTSA